MRRIRTLFYGLVQGIRNIRRNRMFSMASIGTMTACLFLFGIFYSILINFQHILKTAEQNIGITVFFDEDYTQEEIDAIGNSIMLRPEVESIEFISAEQTWENYKAQYLDEATVASFGNDNPLEDSASYVVYAKEIEQYRGLVEYIKQIDGVRQVNSSDTVTRGLESVNKAVTYISIFVIAILAGVAIFLISTTIATGISVRKQEIAVMKLIGATDFFIGCPYVVEGIILGLIGAMIPVCGLFFLYQKLMEFVTREFVSDFEVISFLGVNEVFRMLIPVSLLAGIGIGMFGSYTTLKRELRKIN